MPAKSEPARGWRYTLDCPACWPAVTYWAADPGPHTCELCGTALILRPSASTAGADENRRLPTAAENAGTEPTVRKRNKSQPAGECQHRPCATEQSQPPQPSGEAREA